MHEFCRKSGHFSVNRKSNKIAELWRSAQLFLVFRTAAFGKINKINETTRNELQTREKSRLAS
jgi:hypothetical protein